MYRPSETMAASRWSETGFALWLFSVAWHLPGIVQLLQHALLLGERTGGACFKWWHDATMKGTADSHAQRAYLFNQNTQH
jgi:hypothetical protein